MAASLKFAQSLNRSDMVLALFVVAITAMLLIPLPTGLLDLLLVVNISFSLLLLLVGLYMPNALALLAFPSLLLLTTLFRLGLNVASTRLILLQADAGDVIEAFGTFLIRGEVVVGVIIFVIITIVNFIVIAKGSSRVSEVAARFALDALPGKQMAIDSDLRSGLITAPEAELKREELRKESQLFGSMDGAMKFVQGDAVAGFFIIITNILGGLYLGISNGMSFQDAMQTYTTLTVGDGLVSQIPALLISICAGIVVTRVSASPDSTLGSDVGAQIFRRPGTVVFAGVLLLLIGTLPGLPLLPFWTIGIGFIATGVWLGRVQDSDDFLSSGPSEHALSYRKGTGTTKSLPAVSELDTELSVLLDVNVLHPTYQPLYSAYRQWWLSFSNDFFSEVGISLPPFRISPSEFLTSRHYEVKYQGTVAIRGEIPLDAKMLEMAPEHAPVFGLDVVRNEFHPVTGGQVFWAADSAALRAVLKVGELRAYDGLQYILLRMAEFCRSHPSEYLTMSDVHSSLKEIDAKYPGFLAESWNSEFINVARLTEILQELVREGVSIRNLKGILESISSYCSSYGVALVRDNDYDVQDLVGYIRLARSREFVSRLLSPNGKLRVVSVSDSVEESLEEATVSGLGGQLSLDPTRFEKLRESFRLVIGPTRERGLLPVTLLCSADIRDKLLIFLRSCGERLPVVTFQELSPGIQLEPVGLWAGDGS